jgi:hypothetical protein
VVEVTVRDRDPMDCATQGAVKPFFELGAPSLREPSRGVLVELQVFVDFRQRD